MSPNYGDSDRTINFNGYAINV